MDIDSNESVSLDELAEHATFFYLLSISKSQLEVVPSGEEFNEQHFTTYQRELKFFWTHGDLDSDGELSENEFEVVLSITGVYYESWERKQIRTKMDSLDVDSDKVEPEHTNTAYSGDLTEVVVYKSDRDITDRSRKRSIAADTDKNGLISVDEMVDYYVKFNVLGGKEQNFFDGSTKSENSARN